MVYLAHLSFAEPNWSINVAKRALNIGLDDDLVGDFNGVKAVNREEACLYALNTLTADMVEYDAKTTVSTNGTSPVLSPWTMSPGRLETASRWLSSYKTCMLSFVVCIRLG